jgi:L-galactose dehydrogenase
VLTDGLAALQRLRDEGKCRFVGMTGYPLKTMERVIRETGVDVILTYAKATLLDGSLAERIVPLAAGHGTGVINAAAVALGLLTPNGTNILEGHPATPAIRDSAVKMRDLAAERSVDISFIASQYSVWRCGAATTAIGTGKVRNLESAVAAARQPPDPELEEAFLALRPPATARQWVSGLPEDN